METRRHDLMEAYAGQVVLGQEEERRHIAQELHDGPLQTLIHLCRQIDSLVRSGARAVPDIGASSGSGVAPGSQLAAMRTTVEETVAELRSIARGLRPSVLDDLGLVASINQIVTEAIGAAGVRRLVRGARTGASTPSAVELALFRIAQEADHQRRTSCRGRTGDRHPRVRRDRDPAAGPRTTESDSNRPASEPVAQGHSLGLPGMGERARLIGGRLKVRSQVGNGTTVEVWVPTAVTEG